MRSIVAASASGARPSGWARVETLRELLADAADVIDAVADHQDDGRQPHPRPRSDHLLGRRRHEGFARLGPAVALLDLTMAAQFAVGLFIPELPQEVVRYLLVQGRVVFLQRQ